MESATRIAPDYDAFPTAHGPVLITGAKDKEIISLDASTGSVNWRLTMSTGLTSDEKIAETPQIWRSANKVVVSPDGKYLAIRTHSYLTPEDSENIGDQRVGITVLDTETGDTVRTVEISGLVLGQALTNDSLAVETAQNYYPAGTGAITVFSLSDAQAEPTSFRSDQWLIGASPGSLIMSQELPPRDSYDALWPYTITKVNTTGEELGTVIGVRALQPGGWIDRFKDPEAAAAIVNSQSNASEHTQALEALQHELFHVDTETTLDAENLLVADVILPSGAGILLYTQRTESEERKPTVTYPTPVSWLDTTSSRDSLRQEKMTQILHHASQDERNDGFFPSRTTLIPGVEAPPESLPKEQYSMSDSSIPEDDTVTDDVSTPATEDTDTTEPAKDLRRYTFLSRHISALRALRLSGILTLFPAIALHIYSGSIGGNFDMLEEHFSYVLLPVILLSLLIWFWSSLYSTFQRLIALVFMLHSVTNTGFLMHRWWRPYARPCLMPDSLPLWRQRLCNQPWFMPDF